MMSELVLAEKTCTKCGVSKSLTEFYNDKNASDGRTSWCGACTLTYQKAYQKLRRELMGDEAWKAKNREVQNRFRESGKDHGLDRKAYRRAQSDLRQRHQEEFAALLRNWRYELGLNPDSQRAKKAS